MKLVEQVKSVELVPDWRAVLKHAWSVRLMLVAALLSGCEILLVVAGPPDGMPLLVFAGLSGSVTVAAIVARVILQSNLSGAKK